MSLFSPQPTLYRGQVFPSQRALARHLGVADQTVFNALARGTVDDIGCGRGKPRPCVIDGVRYPSQSAAARALGVHPSTISFWLARERTRP